MKKENEKGGLKLNTQRTKIMASSPITSWQIGNGNSERLYLGSIPKSLQMVTAAMKSEDDYFLGMKAMTNLDNVRKSRDISLLTKVHIS